MNLLPTIMMLALGSAAFVMFFVVVFMYFELF